MTESDTGAFRDSLTEHNATSSVVEAAEFQSTVRKLIDGPAVGAPIPFDGVSLDELPVTTDPTPCELEEAEVGITGTELAVADYGSFVLRTDAAGTEAVSLFPETHVAVVAQNDILPSAAAAFENLGETARTDRSSAVIATGPSATADMGGLVYGAHGPTDVHVIILSDR